MISPWSWPAFVAACPWKHPRQRSRAQGAKIQVALANELSSTQHASEKIFHSVLAPPSWMALSGVDGSTGWTGGLVCITYIYIYISIQYMNYSSKRIPQFWPWSDAAWVPSQLWLSSWPIAKNKSLGLNPWIRPAWPSNFAGPPGLRRMLKSGTRSLDPWSKPSFNRWIANSHRNNDR